MDANKLVGVCAGMCFLRKQKQLLNDQVAASSVNPVDWKMVESPTALAWKYPHVLGRDCAGTVVAVGYSATRLRVGDEVWADSSGEGCYGEYVALEESSVAWLPFRVILNIDFSKKFIFRRA